MAAFYNMWFVFPIVNCPIWHIIEGRIQVPYMPYACPFSPP